MVNDDEILEYRKRKKRREELRNIEYSVNRNKRIYMVFRLVSVAILVSAGVVGIDWLLPLNLYKEIAEKGWQEQRPYSWRQDKITYMKTPNFTMAVPAEVHSGYDYTHPERLLIRTTPVFMIPRTISIARNGEIRTWEIPGTLFNTGGFWIYLLLTSATFTALKNYSRPAFFLCFLPCLVLAILIVFHW